MRAAAPAQPWSAGSFRKCESCGQDVRLYPQPANGHTQWLPRWHDCKPRITVTNETIEIWGGPDSLDRYSYTLRWETDSPPYCSNCGGNVTHDAEGMIVCTGSTPPGRAGCGARARTMPRGQCFHAPLPSPLPALYQGGKDPQS